MTYLFTVVFLIWVAAAFYTSANEPVRKITTYDENGEEISIWDLNTKVVKTKIVIE